MQHRYKFVVADTSCLILLSKIDQLEILQNLFSTIYTTKEVVKEFGKKLPDWIEIILVKDISLIDVLRLDIDIGEASVIAFALENDNTLLIVDDKKGRRMAERLNLAFTGTLGIILKAKQTGLITSVKYILNKIQETNFRFSQKVYDEILKEADE